MIGAASAEAKRREAHRLLLELHGQAQYALLLVSLLVLAVTGLPQKFDSLGPSRWLMDSAGGIETLRLIHHIAGGVMIFAAVYHFALVLIAVLVFKVIAPLQMIPDATDFRDALRAARYFLGRRQKRVAIDGPSYFEKFDYWLIVWSLSVMGASGLMALFPVRAARLLSGEAVLTVLRVHSDSAIFVVAFVLVVHLIYAALAPSLFRDRRAIFSGRTADAGRGARLTLEPSLGARPAASVGDPKRDPSGRRSGTTVGAERRQEGDKELRR